MTHPLFAGLTHTGIIVDDLDAAMENYSAALGLHWANPLRSNFPLQTRAGALPREMRVTYSHEGPHHLELIQLVDSTAYDAVEGGPLVHHMGYSVKDMEAEIARLEALGFPSELRGENHGADVELMFSYHRVPHGGLFIELSNDLLQPGIQAWANGSSSWQSNPADGDGAQPVAP
jgi:catechol 2,3-dioxygenase-like lactoylglutathione lyase family enzyme